jgi:hypothetical protein
LRVADDTGERQPSATRAALFGGDRLRRELDAQRLRDWPFGARGADQYLSGFSGLQNATPGNGEGFAAQLADSSVSALARRMSAQQALALPSPAASNTVVINARCSLRIEAAERVIVVVGLPVHHYRAEDAVAEAYAMVFLVEAGFAWQTDVARAFARSVRTMRRYQGRYAQGGMAALGRSRHAIGGGPRRRPPSDHRTAEVQAGATGFITLYERSSGARP